MSSLPSQNPRMPGASPAGSSSDPLSSRMLGASSSFMAHHKRRRCICVLPCCRADGGVRCVTLRCLLLCGHLRNVPLVRRFFDMYIKLIADRFALTHGFKVTPSPNSQPTNPDPHTITPTPNPKSQTSNHTPNPQTPNAKP